MEDPLITALDRAAWRALTSGALDAAIRRVRASLLQDDRLRLAWEALRVESFVDVPPTLRSAWIFVLRAGTVTGAERHPNSIQRVMSLRGSADLQTWEGEAGLNSGAGGTWKSNPLGRGHGASTRWLTIPENVWHRPVVDPLDDWIVVSFHTAFADELIEERAVDDEHPDRSVSHTLYAGRSNR